MVDWTTVLIGIGTSLIATGISGICKSIHQQLKIKSAQANLKKDIEFNHDSLSKKVTASSSLVEMKSISVNFLTQIGRFFKRKQIQTLGLSVPLLKKSNNVELKRHLEGLKGPFNPHTPIYGSYRVSIPVQPAYDMDVACLFKKV